MIINPRAYGRASFGNTDMRFIKTNYGWHAYALRNRAYVYVGHFYTQREARAALATLTR